MEYIKYVRMTWYQKLWYKISSFFIKLGKGFLRIFVNIYHFIIRFVKNIGKSFKTIFTQFKYGDTTTKLSYFFLGVGHIAKGQIFKGIFYLLTEIIFIVYLILAGIGQLIGLVTLGTRPVTYTCPGGDVYGSFEDASEFCDFPVTKVIDDSSKMLLFGIVSVVILIAFVAFYLKVTKSAYELQIQKEEKKHINTILDDFRELFNGKFHVTLLFLPIIGIMIFNILPLINMIAMAFTNFDSQHPSPMVLFDWVGFDNFINLFSGSSFATTFRDILLWTIVWAILATFLNFFLGMIVAIIINKKGIKLKKFWRTVLVLSIAVPQFVSLLSLKRFLDDQGMVNIFLRQMGWIGPKETIEFLSNGFNAKITIVIVNIWIGIPYTVLSTTGILMNIPADLYESARIDGASPFKQYRKITLPYIMFVMTPYLITQFISNINNFGVIYYLTGGAPLSDKYYGSAGETDLLITWLYKLTVDKADYSLASVIGIMSFIICAAFSMIVYRNSASFNSEEDFQ